MKKNKTSNITFVAVTLAVVIAVFTAGAFVYNKSKNDVSQEDTSLFVRDYSFVLGEEDAKITVVEFFDPACPACAQIAPAVEKLPEQYLGQVKVVYRDLAFHQGSDQVLSLLAAAKEQGKYKETLRGFNSNIMHWYANGQLNVYAAYGVIQQAGVDGAIAQAFLEANNETISERLKQNIDDAIKLNVTETPTFFVNFKRVKPSELTSEIEAQIEKLYK